MIHVIVTHSSVSHDSFNDVLLVACNLVNKLTDDYSIFHFIGYDGVSNFVQDLTHLICTCINERDKNQQSREKITFTASEGQNGPLTNRLSPKCKKIVSRLTSIMTTTVL